MKQVLRIRNKGLVQAEDIMLIGSSTKRGVNGKIGQFGSGWKYALAWLMRNDATPRVYAGFKEIVIDSRMIQHRNNIVSVISVDGKETSITTDMGMKWTAWMALRELISNAIDEGEEIIEVLRPEQKIDLEDGYTNIFIDINDQIKEVMGNYEYYFAFDRTPDWISDKGALYIKNTNTPMNVYRRGIRCYDSSKDTMIDFNFAEIEITEDRLIQGGEGAFDSAAKRMLEACTDTRVLKAAILSEYKDIHPNHTTESYVETYKQMLQEGFKFTTKTYKDTLGIFTDGVVIGSYHFAELVRLGLISNPLEAIFRHLDFAFSRVDDNGLAAIVENILSKTGSTYKVYFGTMDTYGHVKVKENEFYIKSDYLTADAYEIAGMCLSSHENAHVLIGNLLK